METIKELKIEGLYLVVNKIGRNTYCKLMSKKYDVPVQNYISFPVKKVSDIIKAIEETFNHLDWTVDDFYNIDEYIHAYCVLGRKIVIEDDKYVVK